MCGPCGAEFAVCSVPWACAHGYSCFVPAGHPGGQNLRSSVVKLWSGLLCFLSAKAMRPNHSGMLPYLCVLAIITDKSCYFIDTVCQISNYLPEYGMFSHKGG